MGRELKKRSLSMKQWVVICIMLALTAFWMGRNIRIPAAAFYPFREAVQIFSVFIFISIFTVSWWRNEVLTKAELMDVIAIGFLFVGLFNLGHLLSYPQMPAFVTENSISKSMAFELLSRVIESTLFFVLALTGGKWIIPQISRSLLLIISVIFGSGVFLVIFNFLPKYAMGDRVFLFYAVSEHLAIALLLVSGIIFAIRMKFGKLNNLPLAMSFKEVEFLLIIAVAILSEGLSFNNPDTTLASMVSPALKVLYCILIYYIVLVASFTAPYQRLKKTKKILQQSEQKYSAMIDTLSEAILLILSTGEIQEVNIAFCELSGYQRENLIGRPVFLFIELGNMFNGANCASNLIEKHELMFEARLLNEGGKKIPTEILVKHVQSYDRDSCMFVMHDLRERQKAQIQQTRALAIFENSTDGIMVMKSTGEIEMINHAFSNIFGFDPPEIVGKKFNLKDCFHVKSIREIYRKIKEEVELQGKWRGQTLGQRKSGETFPLWVTIMMLDLGEGVKGYTIIFSDLSKEYNLEKSLIYKTTHDLVTELPNRFYFLEQARLVLGKTPQHLLGFAVFLLNIKGMKGINTISGFPNGDKVLRELADRLRRCLSKHDVIGRWEGDEFIFLLSEAVSSNDIMPHLQKVMGAVNLPFTFGERVIPVNLSIGIAVSQTGRDDVESLINAADLALDKARKQPGKTTYCFYQPEMQEQMIERMTWEARLRKALEQKEFCVYYQPQVSLRTRKIVGLEALVRWRHPELGIISPAQFIPIAEESRMIIPLGEVVLRQVCEQIRVWQGQGVPALHVAVNLSAVQFQQPEFVEQIRAILNETDLDSNVLVLEITESIAIEEIDHTQRTINLLRKQGIEFAMDDFGTGYSSLNYLKKFPMEWLKIDRSFIEDILVHPEDAAIVEAIVHLSKGLHMKLVVEGVEQEDQLRLLENLGCEIIQGYIFSPPLPAPEIQKMLLSKKGFIEQSMVG